MTTFFKDMCKISNKIEYLVIGLYKEDIYRCSENRLRLTDYISKYFESEMVYSGKCASFEIVKTRPNIGDTKYQSLGVDYFAIPIQKVIFDMEMIRKIRDYREKKKHWREGISNYQVTKLVKKYTKQDIAVVFKKSKREFNEPTRLCSLWYEGSYKNRWCYEKHQTFTYYAIMENNPEGIYYLNPDSQSAIQFSCKIGTFETIWRELINRKLKEYGFFIKANEAKPNICKSYKGDTSITLRTIYGEETYKVDKVMSDIKFKISELVKKELQENLKDFAEVLDACKIDSNDVLKMIHNIILEGGFHTRDLATTINLKELTHDK